MTRILTPVAGEPSGRVTLSCQKIRDGDIKRENTFLTRRVGSREAKKYGNVVHLQESTASNAM